MYVSSLPLWLGIGASSRQTYTIVPAALSVSEGSSLQFTVNTTSIPTGTVLYYNLSSSSTATTADFTSYSGSFTINSNTGTFTVTLATDLTVESEVFYMDVKTASISGTIVATSPQISIIDTSPTYSLSPASSSVNEGDSLIFTVTTTNVANNTILYFNLNTSSTATTADFSVYSGSCTITSNSSTFSVTVARGDVVENEYFYMDLKTGSITGTIVATSSQVTITDVFPTYSVIPQASSVNEGSSLNFTVATTYVADGTVLYFNLASGSTATTADFSTYSGSCTITNNLSSFTVTVASDFLIETETFSMALLSGSITGTVLATSSTVTINSPTYSVSPASSTVAEGSSISFTVTTTFLSNGTTLYYNLGSGTTAQTGDFTSYSGSFTISNNSGSFTVSVADDTLAESEVFTMSVLGGSTSGTTLATSSSVTITNSPGTITWTRTSWQTTGTIISAGTAAANADYLVIGGTSSGSNQVYVVTLSNNSSTLVNLPAATGGPIPSKVWYEQDKWTIIGTASTGSNFAAWQCAGTSNPTVSGNWTVTNITGLWPGNVQGSLIKNSYSFINNTYVAVMGSGVDSGASEYIIWSSNGTSWSRATTAFSKTNTDAYSCQSMASNGSSLAYLSRNLSGKAYTYNSTTFSTSSAFTQASVSYVNSSGTTVQVASPASISITWTKEVGWIWAGQGGSTYISSGLPVIPSTSGPTTVTPTGGSKYVVATKPSASETTRVLILPSTSGTYSWSYSKNGGSTWVTVTAPTPPQNNWDIGAVCSFGNNKIYVIDEYWGYLWIATIA